MENKKKGLISFSGGETSAFMLWWLLMNKSDEYDFKIIFANTGRENDETLDFVKACSEYFKCEVVWVEAVIRFKVRAYGKTKTFTSFEEKEKYYLSFSENQRLEYECYKIVKGKKKMRLCIEEVDCGTIHKKVTYETATRNQDWKNSKDTPYEMMVKKFGLANINNRISTRELKERPIHSYLKSIGWKRSEYYTFIGIRVDEFDRMSEHRVKDKMVYPLVKEKPMTKKHINFWWNMQPFRLLLKGWEGNCVTCYKKSIDKLTQIMIDDSWKFEFDEYLETEYGYYIPRKRVLHMLKQGKELPELPLKIFRDNHTVSMIKDLAKNFKRKIKDDSRVEDLQLTIYDDEEACEVFTACGKV